MLIVSLFLYFLSLSLSNLKVHVYVNVCVCRCVSRHSLRYHPPLHLTLIPRIYVSRQQTCSSPLSRQTGYPSVQYSILSSVLSCSAVLCQCKTTADTTTLHTPDTPHITSHMRMHVMPMDSQTSTNHQSWAWGKAPKTRVQRGGRGRRS